MKEAENIRTPFGCLMVTLSHHVTSHRFLLIISLWCQNITWIHLSYTSKVNNGPWNKNSTKKINNKNTPAFPQKTHGEPRPLSSYIEQTINREHMMWQILSLLPFANYSQVYCHSFHSVQFMKLYWSSILPEKLFSAQEKFPSDIYSVWWQDIITWATKRCQCCPLA